MSLHPVIHFQQLIQETLSIKERQRILNLHNLTTQALILPKFSDHNLESFLLEDKSRALFWDKSESVKSHFSKLIRASGLPSLRDQYGCDWTTSIFMALGLSDFDLEEFRAFEEMFDEVRSLDLPISVLVSIVSTVGIACLIIDDETGSYSAVTPTVPYRTVYLLRSKIVYLILDDSDEPKECRVFKRETGSEIGISKILGASCVPEDRILDFTTMTLAGLVGVTMMEIRYTGDGFKRERLPIGNVGHFVNICLRKLFSFFKIENVPIQAGLSNIEKGRRDNLNNNDPISKNIPVAWTSEYRKARNLDLLVGKTNDEIGNIDLNKIRERANAVIPNSVLKKPGALKGFKFEKGHRVLNFDRHQAKESGVINHVFIPISLITPVQFGRLLLSCITTFSNDISVAKYLIVDDNNEPTHMIVVLVENCSAQPITRPQFVYDVRTRVWTAHARCTEFYKRLVDKANDEIEANNGYSDHAVFSDYIIPEPRDLESIMNFTRLSICEAKSLRNVDYKVEVVPVSAPSRVHHDLSTWYNVWPSMTNEAYHLDRVESEVDLAGSFSTVCRADDSVVGWTGECQGLVMPCGVHVNGGSHAAMMHRCAFQLLGYMPSKEDLHALDDYRSRRTKTAPVFASLIPCSVCRRAFPNKVLAWLCSTYGCPGGVIPTKRTYYEIQVHFDNAEVPNVRKLPNENDAVISVISNNWADICEPSSSKIDDMMDVEFEVRAQTVTSM